MLSRKAKKSGASPPPATSRPYGQIQPNRWSPSPSRGGHDLPGPDQLKEIFEELDTTRQLLASELIALADLEVRYRENIDWALSFLCNTYKELDRDLPNTEICLALAREIATNEECSVSSNKDTCSLYEAYKFKQAYVDRLQASLVAMAAQVEALKLLHAMVE